MNIKRARKVIKLKKTVANTRGLSFIQARLLNKKFWSFSYGSIARALMIGMFWMMIPMPFQMIPAVVMSVYFRANIPITLICVWLSNPVTWLPIYFTNYLFGCYMLNIKINVIDWQSYAAYMIDHIYDFWKPLYLGSIVGGMILGGICFTLVYVVKFLRNIFKV
ncbi:DUF2062 domain-containing protein [Pseudofrancisella aestuarii]|uniref:DUF2062 domain-containing protein n=1 Tax=Pseudofrancisella aestuarii TaxID=2670347 RepID=A0ABV9TCZ9_9GAMM|nr:DUF2062 domain-containing protein [Pseudofrancisella aestuarii]